LRDKKSFSTELADLAVALIDLGIGILACFTAFTK
jgi:hypothetical protein